jgi:hypothetical protein
MTDTFPAEGATQRKRSQVFEDLRRRNERREDIARQLAERKRQIERVIQVAHQRRLREND